MSCCSKGNNCGTSDETLKAVNAAYSARALTAGEDVECEFG